MKRIGNLYQKIIDIENLKLADKNARKGKVKSFGVRSHDQNREANIIQLHELLSKNAYKTSPYDVFSVVTDNGKLREIFRLPYFPDRICHHAILNVLEPLWVRSFTGDTYSCIKGRGIHAAALKVKRALRTDPDNTLYCLKLDIRKFYPSVDHLILKSIIRRKIKDADLLLLLDEIIDSAPGLPIGNYLSQFFANLYLTYFDHWLKEIKKVKYYYRYCDDMVILSSNKAYLHRLRSEIDEYVSNNLNIQIKGNYQVFPVSVRGIDFLGYRFYPTHTLLRKSIKKRFIHKLLKNKGKPSEHQIKSFSAYWGWLVHCDSKNLTKVIMNKFSDFAITSSSNSIIGDKIKMFKVLNKPIIVTDFRIEVSKYPKNKSGKCLHLGIQLNGENHVIFTGSDVLINTISAIDKDKLPFETTIIQNGEHYEFT